MRAEPTGGQDVQAGTIGLFTSLPIIWAESDDLRSHLRGDQPSHWALTALRRHGEVRALDSLAGDGSNTSEAASPLGGLGLLVMAQPRALMPQENVSLDAWVRGGGHLLLFADPMLTEESAFGLGDKRRPQDMVMLSPILTHWNVQLEFDDGQPAGERQVSLREISLPVNLPGRLLVAPGSRHCAVLGEGLLADCRLGKGRVLIVADAAMLERQRGVPGSGGPEALDWLLARLGN